MREPISGHDPRAPLITGFTWSAADTDIAIVEGERSITYAQLNRRSRVLAGYLRSIGVTRDVVVGIHLQRSAASIVAALAILAAGGAFLPLDPAQPRERSNDELSDAGAHAVISAALGPPDSFDACPSVPIDAEGSPASHPGDDSLPYERSADIAAAADDLAYVIYTSGSTGRPKGVEMTHGGLANLVAWHRWAFAVTSADRASHLCAVGFDAAVWEVWPYLKCGATIVIAGEPVAQDPARLRNWLIDARVTIGFVPTPLAERLIELPWPANVPLRTLLTGADRLHAFPPATLPFALVNNYGPTEATVVATSGRVPPRDEAPTSGELPSLGRPIANVDLLVAADDGEPVADGEEGEIWIGGAGLARGYRNRPDLTALRFVEARFAARPPGRFYRTGDRGRFTPDGELMFLGRDDEQMNLRGYRIEPGEIEAALNLHPAIRACAAIIRGADDGEERLVAYVSAFEGALPPGRDLRAFLAGRLPAYMIPTSFIELRELPVTVRGKIDRAALRTRPVEPVPRSGAAFVAARSVTEGRLAEIVAQLLGAARVSIDDDLLQIGGHSLLLMKLLARIRDAFGVELGLRLVFDAPTIAALAAEIERSAPQSPQARAAAAPIPRRTIPTT